MYIFLFRVPLPHAPLPITPSTQNTLSTASIACNGRASAVTLFVTSPARLSTVLGRSFHDLSGPNPARKLLTQMSVCILTCVQTFVGYTIAPTPSFVIKISGK